ncbi:DUF2868 domain-containing protein [Luteolibacter sp. SL250]|uniref:DUF2868 domain-containing protein n=1 Tax=Luteolibacter sp. SL250 TaxID=2995170 RepID=UPI00227049C9|nr:DUF2868 domain-containing protein [Luteolibacter sp. SL250]WAC19609.1 DUF2868 domain-containing protein [Luteolibacter sp. SL250]
MIFTGWGIGANVVRILVDQKIGGMNVVHYLAVVLGSQWLVLVVALAAWLFRRRSASGFTGVQAAMGGFLRKLTKDHEGRLWGRIMDGGPFPKAALLWRLASFAQLFGVWFNVGIISVLGLFVLTKNIGFHWETTTEEAMRASLVSFVHFLSLPWVAVFPAAVPDAVTIDATRLLPAAAGSLPPGPAAWWLFLLMATVVWGLLPRLVLWAAAATASRRALASIDFQARHHRALWRDLAGVDRAENDEKPLDGVLVLDVGGSGFQMEIMRPFLLQKLRVHPASWQTTAVLDPGAEKEAAAALALAPAGVVLLAEGWALSPPRMTALHSQIRTAAGSTVPVKFLVANEVGGSPERPTVEEIAQWERFVDSLRDPRAEVYFYA